MQETGFCIMLTTVSVISPLLRFVHEFNCYFLIFYPKAKLFNFVSGMSTAV